MNNVLITKAVEEFFRLLPGGIQALSIVGADRQDPTALPIAEEIVRGFPLHAIPDVPADRQTLPRSKELLLSQGTPFFERLEWVADKAQLPTYTYLATSPEEARYNQERIIRHLIGLPACLIAFPKSPCPKMIHPLKTIESLRYQEWGAVAMATKLGIRNLVFASPIYPADTFAGPLLGRAEVLVAGPWGSWLAFSPAPEDLSAENQELLKTTGEKWVEGAPTRRKFYDQN